MPSDDLILAVKQIAGYPPTASALPTDAVVLQRGGLGGPYLAISLGALVGTALAQGGAMAIGGALSVASVSAASVTGSNASFGVLGAQQTCFGDLSAAYGSIGGSPIATQADLAIQAANSVASFNGRTGAVTLWIDDIVCAGGAPIFSPVFQGSPRAITPPPTSSSSRLATTAFVQAAVAAAQDLSVYAPLDSPNLTGVPTAPTAAVGSSDGQLATTAFVMNAVQESTTGVASFNTRVGAVTLTAADLTAAGGALLASPVFSGVPAAPTAAPGASTAQLATTQFVTAALAALPASVASFNGRTGAVTLTAADVSAIAVASFNGRIGVVSLIANDVSAAGGAMLASPAFTGTPSAPTAAPGVSTAQLATTAFVMAAIAAVSGVSSFNGRTGAVVLAAADLTAVGGALLAAPAFTGAPTSPTAAPGTNTTQLATTAFVQAAVAAGVAGVASFNGRTGAVTLLAADISAAGGAPLNSPALTGSPSAPTPAVANNSTLLATTAFVTAAIAAIPAAVASFNGRVGVVTLAAADLTAASPAPLAGVANASSAAAGQIGEVVTAGPSSGIPVTTTQNALATLSLTAGDWDLHGVASVTPSASMSSFAVWLTATSGGGGGLVQGTVQMNMAGMGGMVVAPGVLRVSLAATQTVYMYAIATPASGTVAGGGYLWARRMR